MGVGVMAGSAHGHQWEEAAESAARGTDDPGDRADRSAGATWGNPGEHRPEPRPMNSAMSTKLMPARISRGGSVSIQMARIAAPAHGERDQAGPNLSAI